jgi:hypothetical protein
MKKKQSGEQQAPPAALHSILGMAALVFDFILFAKMTLLGAQRSGANQ